MHTKLKLLVTFSNIMHTKLKLKVTCSNILINKGYKYYFQDGKVT